MTLFVQSSEITRLVETGPPPEISFTRVARIEFLGDGQVCCVLCRSGMSPSTGEDEYVVCGRVFGPTAFILPAMELGAEGLIKAGLAQRHQLSRRLFS